MTYLTHYSSEATTLLSALIGIPSISREEEKAADFLQNFIEETGIMTGRSGNNIWCICPNFDTNKPTILLNSHIDTVKPVTGWRKQPFTAKIENGQNCKNADKYKQQQSFQYDDENICLFLFRFPRCHYFLRNLNNYYKNIVSLFTIVFQ